MTSRRAPLASVPNAINSPFRNIAATNGKRARAQLGDAGQDQPPAKRQQVIEIPDDDDDEENIDPRSRAGVLAGQLKLDEPFSKRSNSQPTAFDRKLAALRDKKPTIQQPQAHERLQRAPVADNSESVRQWQRHYRRQFPSFVIYFDGVSDDVRLKTVRHIQSLGAREEKFFSRSVTHVVTTRQIPSELTNTSPDEDVKGDGSLEAAAQPAVVSLDQRKTTNLLDAHLHRRTQTQAASITHDVDPRKAQGQGADILSRARQYGIKIWALEKLHRMLKTIMEAAENDMPVPHGTRSQTLVGRVVSKTVKDADLEQLLRNEKVNGPADRDMTVAAQDMCTFQGFYIYVHDMNEKTKPVMVRDYPKPASRHEGKWPQFRMSGPGRCPFLEEPLQSKKSQQQAATKAQDELSTAQRKTRAVSAQQSASTRGTAQPLALIERQPNLRRSPRKLDVKVESLSKSLDPPRGLPAKRQSSNEGMPSLFGSTQQTLRGLPRMIGGEPVASGLQHSNVTSAIRSQYISSAAISSTAPGANHRIGDSKEVSVLKRKVLERGANVNSHISIPASYMNDMRAAINNDNDRDPPPRAAKRKAQETLGVVHEDDENGGAQQALKPRKSAAKQRKPVERDPKPGYCENCRDKFEDFDEHCQSRKHRKFATSPDNWKELDVLLSQLKRPHKAPC
ncbi:Cdc7p-Dbf4p kinase complex regulatory subunit [Friedmanniomyces endolithicus]|nr:Cdc7p-Dbf4p kinase complex regulatory subunit [Friedmanniomyces endolithicus]